ncbi:podocalyxin [Rhinatrema bivittatum]|uniref:podocalyxin n=1 Tax=Rhinatrema bivittatum TaxID=194408 RepID=UPI001127CA61|nr:podocalyxin [Rhinatrema bivittatum]
MSHQQRLVGRLQRPLINPQQRQELQLGEMSAPTPSASTGKTVTTLSSLAVPTVLSPAPGGDTLTTTSLEGSTTATQTQETPTSRGHATSLTPGDFSPVLTPTAAGSGSTSQRLLVTVPGTGPSKPDTGKPPFAIKIVCERHNLSSASVIILNQVHPRPCDHSLQVVEKGLPEMLCLKVKSTFTPSTDQCTVRLGYSEDPAKKLAILGVSVESHSAANEIYEMLAGKTEKLKEFGFSAVNYPSHKERSGNEDWLSMPLIITIVCMAVSLLLIAAIYGWWHQRHSTRKDQQRLTEELQTVENGYHDNPTLDVMETSPEMQEKKAVGLNGELGDSWIVPMDHLGKEDLEEEEDTHL